jgi:hypothetical protein
MFYRLFGWWYRWQACKLAALTMSNRHNEDEGICPNLWSAAVFFELYLLNGANETQEEFGPKEPIELKEIKNG